MTPKHHSNAANLGEKEEEEDDDDVSRVKLFSKFPNKKVFTCQRFIKMS